MHNMHKLTITLLLLFVCALPLAAQDTPVPECDLEAAIADARAALDEAEGLIDEDAEAALEALAEMRNALATAEAACAGLRWEGENDTIIGPVEFPDGVYIATLTLTGDESITSARLTELDGRCGYMGLMVTEMGETVNDVVEFDGCRALIEISSRRGTWSLWFEFIE